MNAPPPLVSVILPVFDRAGSVARAIESVFAQSYANLELIVVDDGSTDGTAAVLERYRDAATILSQANRGTYAARNLGLKRAVGDYVAFIDSDDAWLPDKLQSQVQLMRPGVGLVYGDIDIVTAPDHHAPPTGRRAFTAVTPRRGWVLEAFHRGNFVPTCTVLVRRTALLDIGGFSEEQRISADYLAWFRVAQYHAFDYVDAPVAVYTQHAAGISYDLGRALAVRIALFRDERRRVGNPTTRAIIDRLLFNLGLHLALAKVRGRAKTVARPLAIAREAMATTHWMRALRFTAAFAAHQMVLRARCLKA